MKNNLFYIILHDGIREMYIYDYNMSFCVIALLLLLKGNCYSLERFALRSAQNVFKRYLNRRVLDSIVRIAKPNLISGRLGSGCQV